jgi:hypothetical protein
VALNNSILGQPVAAANVNVSVDVGNRRVTVGVQSTQNTYFARALGLQTANVGAQAVAEASAYSTGTACPKPWFIPNTVLSPSAACNGACDANEVLISGGQVTAFAQDRFGQQISLKAQDPHNGLSPGQFYAMTCQVLQGPMITATTSPLTRMRTSGAVILTR